MEPLGICSDGEITGFARLMNMKRVGRMETKGQVSKMTKTVFPGQRNRGVKRANKELEFRHDCQVLKYISEMVSEQLSVRDGSLGGDH